MGILSLAWLLLRSGLKPSRLRYPCQQAALSAALSSLAYWMGILGLTAVTAGLRLHLARTRAGIASLPVKQRLFLLSAATLTSLVWILALTAGHSPAPLGAATTLATPSWVSPSAVSDVFLVRNVPAPVYSLDEGILPGGVNPGEAFRDAGIDMLVNLMATHDLHFYKTASTPDGLFGTDDVVVIKINNQWSTGWTQRYNHTRVDLVKGLIYRLVQHPDGFTGAVILGENTQGMKYDFDNEDNNNAQDPQTSYQDVVDAFVSQGYAAATSVWDNFGGTFVGEFSAGDMDDGYVTGAAPGGSGNHELSWPKFTIEIGGTTYRISMRYGLWNGSSYESSRLKLINFPVMKAHGMAGATLALKNYIGFLTIANTDPLFSDWDEMHGYFWGYSGMHRGYGLLARQIARVRHADLDILDGIWINPMSNTDDSDSCVRGDLVLASRDPVALDYYASSRILSQVAASPADVNAATHDGIFREFMLCLENRLRNEGITNIINLDDSFTQAQEEAQFSVYVMDAGTAVTPTPTTTQTATRTETSTRTPTPTPTQPVLVAPTALDPESDLSGDGWIDAKDLMILLRNWHHMVTSP